MVETLFLSFSMSRKCSLLIIWQLLHFLFADEGFDDDSFAMMTIDSLKEIIPKLGIRLKFVISLCSKFHTVFNCDRLCVLMILSEKVYL